MCLASGAGAQSVFLGSVVTDGDAAAPLAGAEITIPALNFGARTDSLGRFFFRDIPKGAFKVVVRRVGYNAIAINARFSGSDTLAADFALIPSVVALDTVNVVGGARQYGKFLEFEERRSHGGGAFLTRHDLDRRKGAQRGCYSQVYVDNVRVFSSDAGEALFNINSIPPSAIQGIEYYASREETPVQYASSRAECGTMLIWTRIE